MPYIVDFVTDVSQSDNSAELKYVNELVQTNPDLLVFGDELNNPNIKQIFNSTGIIQKFGGPVGELFYASPPV